MSAPRLRPAVRAAIAVVTLVASAAACSGSGTDEAAPTGPAGRGTAGPATTVAASAHASGPSVGCQAGAATPAGTTDLTLSSGGQDRRYRLEVPAGYDGTRPFALVLGLHSLTVDYRIVPGMSGFTDMAARYDFIGVSPSGLVSTAPYWNAAPVADNGDLAFLTDLLDHLEATLCIDTGRVFSIGMSNGAQMSSLLACRIPDRITAIAPIAGVELNQPCDGGPVPVIAFHGVADPIVPYEGGGMSSVQIANANLYKGSIPQGTATPTGVDESMRRWAEHNGCDPAFVETRVSPEVRKRTWSGCRAATEIYLVDGGGHAWPGKPQPAFEASFGHGTTDIDATALSFAFFFDGRT